MSSYSTSYNPDVLSTLANLSSDEVFTPPHIANQMLDLLPQELFQNKNTTFLDPATKSGVFLREITKRLIKGLENEIPDLQERIDHILHNQVFGVAITELTALLSRRSLYCSKNANGKYSISTMTYNHGNISFVHSKHNWKKGKCTYCGASKTELDREDIFENYAYPFIHQKKGLNYFDMNFDVIIGNPPYQLNVGNSGGNKSKAKSIYNLFIDQAIKLNPRFLVMITPSRWMTRSVEGIPSEWIDRFINDERLVTINDYLDAKDIFSGTPPKGGVNYFLWSRIHSGGTKYNLYSDYGQVPPFTFKGKLNFMGIGYVIRDRYARDIIKKIVNVEGDYILENKNFSSLVSPKDFYTNKQLLMSSWDGYSSVKTEEKNIKLYLTKSIHKRDHAWISIEDVPKNKDTISYDKVYISAASGSGNDSKVIGKVFYGEPNSVCSQTYLVIGYSRVNRLTYDECQNVISYIKTKFFRYLLSVLKKTQNGPRNLYQLIPLISFNEEVDDELLYKRYSLSNKEIEYIEQLIVDLDAEHD